MVLIFFFNNTATTEIYTLSLHDALPICGRHPGGGRAAAAAHARDLQLPRLRGAANPGAEAPRLARDRSEEHTSELQSRQYLVCRLLLEKKHSTALITSTHMFKWCFDSAL